MELYTVITVLYAQIGFFVLASLVYRRIAALRGAVAASQSGRESLARNLDAALADLERRLASSEQELGQRRAKRAVRRISGLRRRRALEMLQAGKGVADVAQELDLRPPEASFLARLAAETRFAAAQRAP